MDKFATNIEKLLLGVLPYSWLLPVVGIFVIGVCKAIPSDKTHEFANKHWAGIIIGTMLCMGCIYLGKWGAGKISF